MVQIIPTPQYQINNPWQPEKANLIARFQEAKAQKAAGAARDRAAAIINELNTGGLSPTDAARALDQVFPTLSPEDQKSVAGALQRESVQRDLPGMRGTLEGVLGREPGSLGEMGPAGIDFLMDILKSTNVGDVSRAGREARPTLRDVPTGEEGGYTTYEKRWLTPGEPGSVEGVPFRRPVTPTLEERGAASVDIAGQKREDIADEERAGRVASLRKIERLGSYIDQQLEEGIKTGTLFGSVGKAAAALASGEAQFKALGITLDIPMKESLDLVVEALPEGEWRKSVLANRALQVSLRNMAVVYAASVWGQKGKALNREEFKAALDNLGMGSGDPRQMQAGLRASVENARLLLDDDYSTESLPEERPRSKKRPLAPGIYELTPEEVEEIPEEDRLYWPGTGPEEEEY